MTTLLFLLFALAPAFAEDDRYIIALKKDVSFADAKISLEKIGVQVVRESPGGLLEFIAGVIKPELLGEIQHLPFVDFVEEDARRYPTPIRRTLRDKIAKLREHHSASVNSTAGSDPLDTTEVVPYGISYVQADQHEPSGGQIPLCIIDSGVDANHVEFQALNSAGLIQGYPTGYNTDKCSHGTHVAGTIAAARNYAGVIGVTDLNTQSLIIVKVFGDNCAWTYASDLADAGKQCVNRGAKVISMSLGGGRSVQTEKMYFDNEYAKGSVLFVAAAGNSGTSAYSYPASYDSVMSVAAIDESLNKADFSQYNNQVEISAPGVGVLSSVNTGDGEYVTFWYGGNSANTVQAYATTGDSPQFDSPKATVQAPTCDCGTAPTVCPADCEGKLCLISRGGNPFGEKVKNCQDGKGVGAIIYNNVPGTIVATLGSVPTNIPSVTITQADGIAALKTVGQTAYLAVATSNWEYYDGTSMATPHVSGVAALVWSYNPKCSNAIIRQVLQSTAQRLPTANSPKNNDYGYGMVLSTPAITALSSQSC